MALPILNRILCAAAVLAGMTAQVSRAEAWSRIDVRTERNYWLKMEGSRNKWKLLGGSTVNDLLGKGTILEAGKSYLISYDGPSVNFWIYGANSDKSGLDANKAFVKVTVGSGFGSAKPITMQYGLSRDNKTQFPHFTTVGMDPSALNAVSDDKKDSSKRVFLAIGVGRALSEWTPGEGGSDNGGGGSSDSEGTSQD